MRELTLFQQFLVEFESEVSDESFVQDVFLEDVKSINTIDDVISYYRGPRNWVSGSLAEELLSLVYLLGVNFPDIRSYREIDVTDNPYSLMKYKVEDALPIESGKAWVTATIPLGLVDPKNEIEFCFEVVDLDPVIDGTHNYIIDADNIAHLITPRDARFILFSLYGYEVK